MFNVFKFSLQCKQYFKKWFRLLNQNFNVNWQISWKWYIELTIFCVGSIFFFSFTRKNCHCDMNAFELKFVQSLFRCILCLKHNNILPKKETLKIKIRTLTHDMFVGIFFSWHWVYSIFSTRYVYYAAHKCSLTIGIGHLVIFQLFEKLKNLFKT